jgi:hypothetical protein
MTAMPSTDRRASFRAFQPSPQLPVVATIHAQQSLIGHRLSAAGTGIGSYRALLNPRFGE